MRILLAFSLAFGAVLYGQTPLPSPAQGGSGGGGTPGGSNTQIQFNNSGAFGGSSSLTWNGTTLSVGTSLSVDGTTGIAVTSKLGNAAFSLLNGAGKFSSGVPVGQAACADLSDASATCATAGAVRALSNLASVSINVALIPQTTLSLGAQATPWQNLYIYGQGTFGSHSLKFDGTPTGNRVITFPDATMTVAGLNQNNIFTANGALSSGAGPGFTANGTWITGGSATTTKPYVLIEPTGTTSTTWATSGTGLGINAASGFGGYLMDLQVIGAQKFSVDTNGDVHARGVTPVLSTATLTLQANNNATANLFGVTLGQGTYSQTSGTQGPLRIIPTYNQASGTAANTDLTINRTETTLGSGLQLFQDWQVAGSSKASLDHLGQANFLNVIARPVAVASLPACAAGTEGERASVNDSNAVSFTAGIGAVVAAGGSTHVPVTCDGTNWRIG